MQNSILYRLVHLDRLIVWDTNLFFGINGLHTPFLDTVMWFLSSFWPWVIWVAFSFLLVITHFRTKTLWIMISAVLVIGLSDQLSASVFKEYFMRLRPSRDPLIQHMVYIVNDYRGGLYGFVSSHAANSFGLVTFFSLCIRKKWYLISGVLWAGLISVSRIYLGVHYPTDILGGAVLGIVCGISIYALLLFLQKKSTKYLRGVGNYSQEPPKMPVME